MPRWPTHAPVVVSATATHDHDGWFGQTLVLGEHAGAHGDAPAHSHPECAAQTIETLAPDFLIGPAKVLHWEERDWRPGELATRADVERSEAASGLRIEAGDIVLAS